MSNIGKKRNATRMMLRDSRLSVLGATALALAAAACSDQAEDGRVPNEPRAVDRARAALEAQIEDQYIVVLQPGTTEIPNVLSGPSVDSVAEDIAQDRGGDVRHVYHHALQGMVMGLSPEELARIENDDRVAYVVPDGIVTAIDEQTNATWGLDRIDQRNLPLDNTYSYLGYGTDVHVYVLDTGIYAEHNEFTGRIEPGWDTVDNDDVPQDCHGHGTHVAGTVAGTTWGVAKAAKIHAVRVLDCGGSGTNSGVIAGIDWVTANHVGPAVANMSLGGGFNQAMNDAVTNSIQSGVTYALAAGNSGSDACNYSPASTPEALTAGASDSSDARASFSNYGTCVDLFAPGVDVTSAGISGPDSTEVFSGTSMASPHIAGVAALILGADPSATPEDVEALMKADASEGLISNPGTGTPNLLVYTGDLPGENMSKGRISAADTAGCGGGADVSVFDIDLAGLGTYDIAVSTDAGDSETVTLTELVDKPGRFEANIAFVEGTPVADDGTLQVTDGVIATFTYDDADDGEGGSGPVTAAVTADCTGPTLSNIAALSVGGTAAVVGASASEEATLTASYGSSCDDLSLTSTTGGLSTTPTTVVASLTKETTYFYAVTGTDAFGNQTYDDNSGECYSFTTASSLLSESFEGGLGQFTVESGLWHASTACASTEEGHSVPGTLYYGQDASCDFANGSSNTGVARSVPVTVDFAASPLLTFNYFLGTEGGTYYDRASAELVVDGGAPIVVASSTGAGEALQVNTGVWQSVTVDLSSVSTGVAVVELLFRFDTIDSIANNFPGFYVDDVELTQVDTSCETDADCDDGIACTVDLCDLSSSTCSHTGDDSLCDNGAFCDGVEVCGATGCQAGSAPACDDGVTCTVDTCDEDSDSCSSAADDSLCDNGLFCDGVETCDATLDCQAGTPLECDDGVDCTVDACDEATQACASSADDSLCDNGLYCDGAETCDALEGCLPGSDPCDGEECDESAGQCVPDCENSVYEAETMYHSTGGSTSGGWNIWSNGYASFEHEFTGGPTDMVVSAAGQYGGGAWPNMTVTVDGVQVFSDEVDTSSWSDFIVSFDAPVGLAEVRVNFTNDYYQNGEDRNLLLDKVTVVCSGSDGGECGDGVVDDGEECDDGNTTPGDGCDEDCLVEIADPACGDGNVDDGEECDDGNTENGDGCDENCLVEPTCDDGETNGDETGLDCGGPDCAACPNGQPCNENSDCQSDSCEAGICVPVAGECGDGTVDPGEECDDGNTTPGDGCDENCLVEVPDPFCGDGNIDDGEECDDGNTTPGDGCDENCQIEVVVPDPVCGDGNLDDGEECDDGNTTPGDGCDAECNVEPACGDGTVDPGEECDDGNTENGDGCDAECNVEEDEGDVEASLNINNDWGSGYCAELNVTNNASQSTSNWSVTINVPQASIYTSWNGNFSGNSGNVSITPVGWNNAISPGSTNTSVGFCANRSGGSSALPTVVSASGSY